VPAQGAQMRVIVPSSLHATLGPHPFPPVWSRVRGAVIGPLVRPPANPVGSTSPPPRGGVRTAAR